MAFSSATVSVGGVTRQSDYQRVMDNTVYNRDRVSKFDSGWVICTAWTVGNSITINHGLNAAFDELIGQIFIRDPAVPGKIYNVTDFDFYTVTMYGERLNGIDGDLDNCYLQIASTSARFVNDAGVQNSVSLTWEYKVVFYKLA